MSRDKSQGCCIAGMLMMLPSGSPTSITMMESKRLGTMPPAAFGQSLLSRVPFRTLD